MRSRQEPFDEKGARWEPKSLTYWVDRGELGERDTQWR
jgi:hypothetical protein